MTGRNLDFFFFDNKNRGYTSSFQLRQRIFP